MSPRHSKVRVGIFVSAGKDHQPGEVSAQKYLELAGGRGQHSGDGAIFLGLLNQKPMLQVVHRSASILRKETTFLMRKK